MSKALVIKGANFAQNAIEQIVVTDPVPCTGITISQDTLDFTEIGATVQLSATVTPADTTEAVTWYSSDEDVVTVNNGLVTCVGVGEAEITVSCGIHQEVCTVTSAKYLDMNTIGVIAHKGLTSTDLDADPPRDYTSVWGQESGDLLKVLTFLSNEISPSGIHCLSVSGYDSFYPIMLPKGASKITVTIPSTLAFTSSSKNIIQFMDSTKQATYNISNKGVLAKTRLLGYNDNISGKQFTYDVPNVDGIDSFAFTIQFTTQISEKPDGMQIVIN